MKSVEIDQKNQCWNWIGKTISAGYGMVLHDGMQRSSHRFSYEMHKGDIPSGLVILHSCDNRRCVNPDHLTAGTQSQNMRDMVQKGRGRNQFGKMKNIFKRLEDAESIAAPIVIPHMVSRGRCTIG